MGKPKSVKIAQKQGIRRKRSVGAYGSKRGIPDKQVHRTEVRYQDGRVRSAIEEAREQQRALEKQIAAEAEKPAMGPTQGAQWVAEQRAAAQAAVEAAEQAEREAELAAQQRERERQQQLRDGHLFEPWEGEGRRGWSIGDARQMLRKGYAVEHVMRMTGVGYRWLSDIPVDADFRGLPDAG